MFVFSRSMFVFEFRMELDYSVVNHSRIQCPSVVRYVYSCVVRIHIGVLVSTFHIGSCTRQPTKVTLDLRREYHIQMMR